VSLGTPQLGASVRVSVQNDKFALAGKPRADVFDKCVKVQRADVRARGGAVAARLLDARPRCRQPAKLNMAEYRVLVLFSEQPDHAIRMNELAAQAILTPSGVTRVIER
jgi:hypothetical protein